MIGKDMTYYTQDVMGLLNKYNPITAATTFLNWDFINKQTRFIYYTIIQIS